MKRLVLIITSCLLLWRVDGQIQCAIDSQYTEPGMYPHPDSILCFVSGGGWNDVTIQFINFDTVMVMLGGTPTPVKINYLIIDSILNLPCGIAWTTSELGADTAHRFNSNAKGCIRFWGVTNDVAGQYKLTIWVRVNASIAPGVELPYDAEGLGFRVDVRVIANAGDICPVVDTTSGATLETASCKFTIAEWPPIRPNTNEISYITSFSFYPNPTNSTASVSFTADKAASYSVRIINIYGQEVSREQLNAVQGANNYTINVSDWPAGVYLFTLTDGKSTKVHRFVVE